MKVIKKGWKVFDKDLKCRDFQFKVGKKYTHKGYIQMCHEGFHYHHKVSDLFNYYSFDKNNRVCEIYAHTYKGVAPINGGDKSVCAKISILKELSWGEVLSLVNSGDYNSGNCNSGDYNSGNCNSGDYNSGNCNSGDCNSGDYNSGDYNSGYYNSGNCNSGDCNSGNYNSGNCNSGNYNSGNYNSGYYNSGYRNSGDCNSGNYNSGNCNSGNYNSGNYNSGYYNSGYRNSGDYNSGYRNSGDYNSGNCNSGVFCTSKDSKIKIFDKKSNLTMSEWCNSKHYSILSSLKLTSWVYETNMTDQEKINNPKFYVANGFLKTFSYKEAWSNLWNSLSKKDKKTIQTMPNFNSNKFYTITGIKV